MKLVTVVEKKKKAVCPHCNGKKWLYEVTEDDVLPKPCICLERERLQEFIGLREIYTSTWVQSELYHRASEEDELTDRTEDNLYIKGTWDVVRQHLHWVLASKFRSREETGFTFRIVEDEYLLQVWLGKKSYGQTPAGLRDKIDTYNTLSDLVPYPSLMIIRLGFIERNRAMANVFHEALKIRYPNPTWIIEGDKRYIEGHSAYNEDVARYIDERFDVINLGGDIETVRQEQEEVSEEAVEVGVAMGPDERPPESRELSIQPDLGGKKPWFRPLWKKKKGGGLSELE